jgi:hypothetical protein
MTTVQPLRINSTEDPFAGIGRTPLFYLDDEEVTIPVDVPASFAMNAIEQMATQGSDVLATRWLMKEVLGDDGHATLLKASARMTKKEMAILQTVIRELVFGQEEEEGKG